MLKYLYVLTSSGEDDYYEQFLLSLTSLKMRMPDAFVSLLTDNKTANTLVGKRSECKKMTNELKIIALSEELSMAERSRWLKTTMREQIKGDFLFLDCDTVIADDLSDLETFDVNIGMVLDHHTLMSNYTGIHKERQKHYDEICRFESIEKMNTYYNSGVMYCKDNEIVHDFFKKWHELWLYTRSKSLMVDQPALNQTNFLMNGVISEIPGIYNCMIGDHGIAYLHNAKILHYFGTFRQETFLLAKKSIFKDIKQTGTISDTMMQMLAEPRRCFDQSTLLLLNSTYTKLVNQADIHTLPLRKAYKIILKRTFATIMGILRL